MFLYYIVFSLSFSALVAVSEYENENEELTKLNTFLSIALSIENLIETKTLNDTLKTIDETWSDDYCTELDKTRVEFAISLMKYHTFFTHYQCTQAIYAFNYFKAMKSYLEVSKNETLLSTTQDDSKNHVISLSKAFKKSISMMMAISLNGNYIPPKWMVMTSLYIYVVLQFEIETLSEFKYFIESNLFNWTLEIDSIVNQFVDRCKTTLSYTDNIQLSLQAKDTSFSVNYSKLKSLEQLIEHSKDLLSYDGKESFELEQWTLNAVVMDRNNFVVFMPTDIGIEWNKLDRRLRDKYNFKISDEDGELVVNRNWPMEIYNNLWTDYNTLNLVKQLFRLVIIRYIMVCVSHCDYMKNQIDQVTSVKNKSQLMSLFEDSCMPIETAVTNAIGYLGTDIFLQKLMAVLSTFKKNHSDVGEIIVKTTAELNRLSCILNVNAYNSVKPQFENLDLLNNETADLTNVFSWVKTYTNAAVQYLDDIKNRFPLVNFQVNDIVQKSIHNQWIETNLGM